jgi:hypothetical protein
MTAGLGGAGVGFAAAGAAATGLLSCAGPEVGVLGAGFAARGAAAALGGTTFVPSGVPQRAQNLKVAAFNVMQFGHCRGGPPAARRGAPGFATAFCCARVASSSPIGVPQDTQVPTSLSLAAPQRGQSMPRLYAAPRTGVKKPGVGRISIRVVKSPACV